MPEGDSLHRIAALLQPLVGHTISASSPNPRGRVTGVAAAIDGRRLESVDAVGKHLLLRFEGSVTVRSHLRMSGRWTVGPSDPARRGSPWLVLRAGAIEAAQWNGPVLTLETRAVLRLGPDLLADTTDPVALVPRLRGVAPVGRLARCFRINGSLRESGTCGCQRHSGRSVSLPGCRSLPSTARSCLLL